MTVNDQDMSPEASPGAVSGNGFRGVNNVPKYIFFAVVSIFLITMAMVASDRAAKQNAPADAADTKATSTSMFANSLVGTQKDGIIPAQELTPPIEEKPKDTISPILIARPDDKDAPPVPPRDLSTDNTNPAPVDQTLQRIREMKLHQLEAAIKATTNVPIGSPRSPGSPPQGSEITNKTEALAQLAAARQQIDNKSRNSPVDFKTRLQQLQASGMGGDNGGDYNSGGSGITKPNNDIGQFDNKGQESRWKLNSKPEAPTSPYELRAGFVIPSLLISGINSDLPGQIMAQVSQNVYDTATGNHLLIPQGSRLVGSYSSDVAYGQSRVLVGWQRIVFPDGKAMDIGAMPGADSAGYGGFTDEVNNHYFRLYGSALLMTAIIAGASYSQNQGQNQNTTGYQQPTASSVLSQALGQQLGQVTSKMISKNLNVSPSLEIRPGYRFNVMVIKDMTFSKPYVAFDY